MPKLRIAFIAIVFIFLLQFFWIIHKQYSLKLDRKCSIPEQPIDAVITWVSGSDPDFINSMNTYRKEPVSSNRFQDFDQMLYSLRSIEQFAPWIRHVYIVTNGQIPNWLNLENEHVSVISHEQIYLNTSHLPTFSSPSIESHLHRIPNLSERFIYLNDDISFINAVCPDDYFDENGQKIYLFTSILKGHPSSQSIFELECPAECAALGGNNICDKRCNLLACRYDSGDCDQIDNPSDYDNGREIYYKSVDYTNIVLQTKLKLHNRWRKWVPHYPFMIEKRVIEELDRLLSVEFDLTSRHRFRAKNDLQYAFLYHHFMNEKEEFKSSLHDGNEYGVYIPLVADNSIVSLLEDFLKPSFWFPYRKRLLWMCANDNIDAGDPNYDATIALVKRWYQTVYPTASKYEKQKFKPHGQLFMKTEADWLKYILLQSLLFFIIIPVLCIKSYDFIKKQRNYKSYKLLKS